MGGSQNARNLNGLGLLACLLLFMLSFMLAFLSDGADPGHVRAARVVVVISGIGTWILFKRARRLRPTEADEPWPPLEEEDAGGEEMAATMERLGLPLDWSVSDPQAALLGGVVKAGIYQAHLSLEAERPDEALSTLDSLLESAVGQEIPGLSEAHGVAFFLKGQALEMKGLATEAADAYRRALEMHSEHAEARRALDRLRA